MFRTRKAKIVSAPVEEVLEVVAPEPEQETVLTTVYNIDQLTIASQDDETATGELIDSNGNQYEYVWEKKLKRISSLTGERVDSLTWMLCDTVLNKYFVRPEVKPVEEPVELKISEALKLAIAPVLGSIKTLENKIATTKQVTAPIVSQPAPRPQIVQSVPMNNDTPAISVADDDISANAMKFLRDAQGDDLGIDYMSL